MLSFGSAATKSGVDAMNSTKGEMIGQSLLRLYFRIKPISTIKIARSDPAQGGSNDICRI
jgi:hypothetical protein